MVVSRCSVQLATIMDFYSFLCYSFDWYYFLLLFQSLFYIFL